jgi:hypothetical protein
MGKTRSQKSNRAQRSLPTKTNQPPPAANAQDKDAGYASDASQTSEVMLVEKNIPETTMHAIKKAMQKAQYSGDFLAPVLSKSKANFVLEDRSSTYQCSAIRAKRPMSEKFATRTCDLFDVVFDAKDFDIRADFKADDYQVLTELKMAYETAKREVPEIITSRLKEIYDASATSGNPLHPDAHLRNEMTLVMGPVEHTPFKTDDDGNVATHNETKLVYPPCNKKHLQKLDALSCDVFGVGLEVLTAPVNYLNNHHDLKAHDIKDVLGLIPKTEEEGQQPKPKRKKKTANATGRFSCSCSFAQEC